MCVFGLKGVVIITSLNLSTVTVLYKIVIFSIRDMCVKIEIEEVVHTLVDSSGRSLPCHLNQYHINTSEIICILS